jgi:hypothetical protein
LLALLISLRAFLEYRAKHDAHSKYYYETAVEKNLTLQQIAELVNIHHSNYFRDESGERELSIDIFQ